MLETDGIATTEERQRLLFAVLCLQLAYEPVYALLLQDINQNRINTDYFETLSHVENLQANVEMIALVRKALPISHDPVEALIRFTSFMSAFKDSIQLESDKSDENRESISESELDLLRQFLFLSSLTSSAGASVNLLGTFRHKAALLTFIEKTLKPKYQVALSTINSAVFTQFKEREAYIGFTFLMAGLSFSIIICWDDKGLSAGLWDEAGGEKKLVRSWFQTNCPGAVSSWNLYATYGYGIFESKAIDANVDDENQRVVEYQAMIDRTFGWALDKLIPLYNEKYPEILKSRSFADKLFYRLSSTYPSSEGWQVDSQLKSLQRGLLVKIQHPDWNSKLCLAIAAGNSMLRSLYFGIYRLKSQRKFGDREQFFYSNYIDKRFPDEKPIAQSGGDWWVFWKYFSPKFGTLFIGDLSQSSAKFAFDTPEGEDEAIESFVEVMSRFKQILPELKDLADSAEE